MEYLREGREWFRQSLAIWETLRDAGDWMLKTPASLKKLREKSRAVMLQFLPERHP
jgi:hypothetical protein